MTVKVAFEDGYVYFKDFGDRSVSLIFDDIQIHKHGNILYVLIDN